MSANGVFTSTLDYSFFGGGFSTIEGGASGDFTLAFTSDVFNPVYAELDQTLTFDVVAGIVTPTVYGEFDGTIDFSLNQSGRIEFGIQSYLTSANNEVEFSASSTGLVPVTGSFTPTFDINFSGTMAQFSLVQGATAFSFDLDSVVQNYTLLNKTRAGKNATELTRFNSSEVVIKQEPNGVKIRNTGITYAEVR
jgi:hypothetical protein|tara:strand:+ start:1583 stop:2164 length:582 start_codon:yes stop_codon:yes gene_type:complete